MDKQAKTSRRTFLIRDGNLYFTRKGERKAFFILTVAMLLAGILVKLGVV